MQTGDIVGWVEILVRSLEYERKVESSVGDHIKQLENAKPPAHLQPTSYSDQHSFISDLMKATTEIQIHVIMSRHVYTIFLKVNSKYNHYNDASEQWVLKIPFSIEVIPNQSWAFVCLWKRQKGMNCARKEQQTV